MPEVHLYTICWDEADMLGFFFRHYDPWVSRFVIYDDGSTDGSRDILANHPKVELRDFVRTDPNSFILSHRAMQESAWKESRGKADWIVMTAIDEHLHVRGQPMSEYLDRQKAVGVTFIPALGFDINAPTMPEDHGLLIERVTRGRPRIAFNKLGIFDPEAIEETGYAVGRHSAEPKGRLVLPHRDELMLWHYKHLGFERNATREATQGLRLGQTDRANNFAQQYFMSREQLRAFWDEMESQSSDLTEGNFVPDESAIRPLWWCNNPEIARVLLPQTESKEGARNPYPTGAASTPKVSVLIKSYNHAPYVRQTIESVLTQTFQDFEIIVTDDGSTDGTVEILRGFSDSRIKLELFPENRGISAAMNATIARAQGRYLAILNSDDWALPHRLQRQVDFLDEHPSVSVAFGLPRPVNETGERTSAFDPFEAVSTLPDFTRRTWLRYFFFERNILCAPTAMIRREAYDDVGLYDRRLTNVQDYDMWIRLLIAGHNIHVIPEELTAFRIRDNNGNASADRVDTRLRANFEMTKVLKHFAALDADDFETLFGEEAARSFPLKTAQRVAHLALRQAPLAYHYFAVDTLYEQAETDADFAQLREIAGSLDVLGVERARELEGLKAKLRSETDQHLENISALTAACEAVRHEKSELEAQLALERSQPKLLRWLRLATGT